MAALRLILISLAGLALFSGAAAGAADSPGTVLGRAELEQAFMQLALGRDVLPAGDIEVSHFAATPEAVDLPPGEVGYRVVSQSQDKPLGQQVIVADITVDEVVRQRVKMHGDLTLFGEVVCLTRALDRQSLITTDDIKRVRRNLTMLGPDLITEPAAAIGKEVKTSLPPGAVLYGRLLKEPAVVKRGDIVSILAATDTVTITVPGRVQNAGALGDLIKVKNLMSRKEIQAKVIGADTVQAQF